MCSWSPYSEIAGSFLRNKPAYFLLGGMALLYALSMPAEYVIGDPFDELDLVASGEPALRSYHLLTTVLYRIAAFLLSWLPGSRMLHLEVFMITVAVFAALGIYKIARQFGSDSSSAAVVTGLFVVADAFWFHGSSIETGMPALAALIWSTHFAWKAGLQSAEAPQENGSHLGDARRLSVTLFSFSVLLHLQAIVLLPALLLLWLPAKKGRDIRTSFLKISMLTGGMIGGVYLIAAVGVLGLQTPTEAVRWFITHGSRNTLAHLQPGLLSIPRALSGLLRLFTDFGGGGTALRGMLSGENLATLDWNEGVELFVALLTTAILAWWIWRGRKLPHRGGLSAASAIGALLVFNCLWLGSDPQFWLNLIPFSVPMIALGLRSSRYPLRSKTIAAAMLLILLVVNLKGREPSVMFPDGDLAHRQAMQWGSRFPQSVILTPGSRWTSSLIAMRANVEVHRFVNFKQNPQFFTVLDSIASHAFLEGKLVFIEGLDDIPPEMVGLWETIGSVYGVSPSDVYSHLAMRYGLQKPARFSKLFEKTSLYRLRPPSQP